MKKYVVLVPLLLLTGAASVQASTVSWDLTTGGTGDSSLMSFVGDDLSSEVSVTAYSLGSWDSAFLPANIQTSSDGIGVRSHFLDVPQLDNSVRYEMLRFELPDLAVTNSITLTLGYTWDDYVVWGNNTGVLPDADLPITQLNGTIVGQGHLSGSPETVFFTSTDQFRYLFVSGSLDTGCLFVCSDDFRVAGLSINTMPLIPPEAISAVPLPAALPFFLSAMGLFGFVGWGRRGPR